MISPAVLKAIAELRSCLRKNGGDVQLIAAAPDGKVLCAITGEDCDDQLILIDPFKLHDPDAVCH